MEESTKANRNVELAGFSKAKPSTGPTIAMAPTSYNTAWRMRRDLGVMCRGAKEKVWCLLAADPDKPGE
jgi:hypothetical protein